MKYKMALVVALIATGAVADINVKWNSQNNYVGNQAGNALIADGTYAVLIWSGSVPTIASSLNLDGTSAVGGEFLLSSTTETSGGGFSFDSANFDDSLVGGADINDGYFFTRIFDTAMLADGNYFAQGGVTGDGSPLIDAGSPPDTSKIYGDLVFSSVVGFGQTTNGYTVVPEPATLGLMGIAGLGMFLARRKNRR